MHGIWRQILVTAVVVYTQILVAFADPCTEIVKLYQRALNQYEVAQKSYLKTGCIEANHDKSQCKGLETATREMQATVAMFAARANLLKCKPQDAQKKPTDQCDRYRSLANRHLGKLRVMQAQYDEQRCQDRVYAPSCKALKNAMVQPKEVIKAIRRNAMKIQCNLGSEINR
jgi:hypothetical protein